MSVSFDIFIVNFPRMAEIGWSDLPTTSRILNHTTVNNTRNSCTQLPDTSAPALSVAHTFHSLQPRHYYITESGELTEASPSNCPRASTASQNVTFSAQNRPYQAYLSLLTLPELSSLTSTNLGSWWMASSV